MCGMGARTALIFWLATVVAGAFATACPETWALELGRALHGEWWRFLSGHATHLSWRHYLLDELALGMAVFLCVLTETKPIQLMRATWCSAAAVSLMLVLLRPVDIYGGLSGMTVGLVLYAALRMLATGARWRGAIVIVAVLAKICSEQFGVIPSDVMPVWQAHCAGGMGGIIAAVVDRVGLQSKAVGPAAFRDRTGGIHYG